MWPGSLPWPLLSSATTPPSSVGVSPPVSVGSVPSWPGSSSGPCAGIFLLPSGAIDAIERSFARIAKGRLPAKFVVSQEAQLVVPRQSTLVPIALLLSSSGFAAKDGDMDRRQSAEDKPSVVNLREELRSIENLVELRSQPFKERVGEFRLILEIALREIFNFT